MAFEKRITICLAGLMLIVLPAAMRGQTAIPAGGVEVRLLQLTTGEGVVGVVVGDDGQTITVERPDGRRARVAGDVIDQEIVLYTIFPDTSRSPDHEFPDTVEVRELRLRGGTSCTGEVVSLEDSIITMRDHAGHVLRVRREVVERDVAAGKRVFPPVMLGMEVPVPALHIPRYHSGRGGHRVVTPSDDHPNWGYFDTPKQYAREARKRLEKWSEEKDSTAVWWLEFTDGAEKNVNILAMDSVSALVREARGDAMRVPLSTVKYARRTAGTFRDGEVVWRDRRDANLFIAPTGRAMESTGSGGLTDIVFWQLSFGLADVVTIEAVACPLCSVAENFPSLFARAKLTLLHRWDMDIAVGYLGVYFPDSHHGDHGMGESLYGYHGTLSELFFSGTYGNDSYAVHCSYYPGMRTDYTEFTSDPVGFLALNKVLILGGELRLGAGLKVMMESWFRPDSPYKHHAPFFNVVGVRMFGRGWLTADIGMALVNGYSSYGFPLLGIHAAF